jgi:hypothetical protein
MKEAIEDSKSDKLFANIPGLEHDITKAVSHIIFSKRLHEIAAKNEVT